MGRGELKYAQVGGRLSKRRVQVAWHAWQRMAGFDRRHPFHCLRHVAITNVYRASRDLFLAQRFARHASPLTTTVYTSAMTNCRSGFGRWRVDPVLRSSVNRPGSTLVAGGVVGWAERSTRPRFTRTGGHVEWSSVPVRPPVPERDVGPGAPVRVKWDVSFRATREGGSATARL
jgi:hypothetical protein